MDRDSPHGKRVHSTQTGVPHSASTALLLPPISFPSCSLKTTTPPATDAFLPFNSFPSTLTSDTTCCSAPPSVLAGGRERSRHQTPSSSCGGEECRWSVPTRAEGERSRDARCRRTRRRPVGREANVSKASCVARKSQDARRRSRPQSGQSRPCIGDCAERRKRQESSRASSRGRQRRTLHRCRRSRERTASLPDSGW